MKLLAPPSRPFSIVLQTHPYVVCRGIGEHKQYLSKSNTWTRIASEIQFFSEEITHPNSYSIKVYPS